ncbi:MAG: superoxide dismutase [Marmoricola sp.]
MTRPRSLVVAAALTLALLPASTAPALAGHGSDHHRDRGPAQIDLPVGWQPEGVTTDRRYVFSGSLATGAILRANPRTGKTKVLPESATGKPAVGIDYDKQRDVIWVAGGPTGEVRAQDARTGRLLATYTAPPAAGRFVNDLVVTRHAVYATDSFNQELLVVPLTSRHGVPPSGATDTLPLTGDIAFVPNEFNANGIVSTKQGSLVVVQSNKGLLFRVDRATGEARTVDLGGTLVTNGDGLELDHRTLYVVQNQGNVAVVHLARNTLSGEVVDNLTNPNFDVATTGALVHHSLWVANARFGVPDPANAEFWLTRVPVPHD